MEPEQVLRIELRNENPVELADFTASMAAFAEAFKDFANENGREPLPEQMRLYVKSMQQGSIVAELIALTQQTQFLLDHLDVLGGFVTNLDEIIKFFLGQKHAAPQPVPPNRPTAKQAKLVANILEPVAKDGGAQMNITINGDVHAPVVAINSMQANAVQNAVGRYLGPALPSTQFHQDELLVLEQVKNSTTAKSGDRGVIEAISPKGVKLLFSSETIKRQILDAHENPFQQVFQVSVEVRAIEGKPAQYRILELIDTFPKPD